MPVKAVQAMLADRSLERTIASEVRAQDKVNAAFQKGYLHGGLRDWALALCQSDETAFDKFLEQSGPIFSHLLKPTHMNSAPGPAAKSEDSPEALAICEQLGLKPGSLAS